MTAALPSSPPLAHRLLLVLEFVSLGVLSTTVTLGLFFVDGGGGTTTGDGVRVSSVGVPRVPAALPSKVLDASPRQGRAQSRVRASTHRQ